MSTVETETAPDEVLAVAVASLPTVPDFEHRRIYASICRKLLGTGPDLMIGRFEVRARIGNGGMGEVYLCHDDQLGREVAVKRVLNHGERRDQDRLRREARSLARLNHPNVVQVYEVGVSEGTTFLAMEYVKGQTLAEWLDTAPERAEIIVHFIAAGRGLAAAHDVGIVHRDFKPDNVLLGADGTVRVADFGIALDITPTSDHSALTVTTPRLEHDELRVTSSNRTLGGTSRYMPLEQLLGRPVDARSDQFAFCVALYEAVWGAPPFPFGDLKQRVEALDEGRPRRPPNARSLWRVVRRGLQRAPTERWPSMAALLDALVAIPVRRRRRQWAAAAVLVAGVGLAFGLRQGPDACTLVERELEGVWDERRRVALVLHFASLNHGHVADSQRLVLERLDKWRSDWIVERRGVCELELKAPERRLQTRDLCLTRQRRATEQLVALLGEADDEQLAAAVGAKMPEPAACADVDAEPSWTPPPTDERAPEIELLLTEIERVRALRSLGRSSEALALADDIGERAAATMYGPLQATAYAERAKAYFEADDHRRSVELYQEAIVLADANGLDALRAELYIERAWLSLFEFHDSVEGLEWLGRADAVYQRTQSSTSRSRARLEFSYGRAHELRGDVDQARSSYEAAIAEARRGLAPELAAYYDALARVVDAREALGLRRKALAFAEQRYGPRHPRTAWWLFNYGLEARSAGIGGADELDRAIEIWNGLEQLPHRRLGKAWLLLAQAALERRELAEVERYADALAELYDGLLPSGHPDRGEPEQLRAYCAAIGGRIRAAIEHGTTAALRFERGPKGPSDLRALSMWTEVGNQLLSLGELEHAAEVFVHVVENTDEGQRLALAQLGLAEIALRSNELEEAQRRLERVAAPHRADFSYQLVLALVEHRKGGLSIERIRALDAERARANFSPEQLERWFTELELTPHERRALGLSQPR